MAASGSFTVFIFKIYDISEKKMYGGSEVSMLPS